MDPSGQDSPEGMDCQEVREGVGSGELLPPGGGVSNPSAPREQGCRWEQSTLASWIQAHGYCPMGSRTLVRHASGHRGWSGLSRLERLQESITRYEQAGDRSPSLRPGVRPGVGSCGDRREEHQLSPCHSPLRSDGQRGRVR